MIAFNPQRASDSLWVEKRGSLWYDLGLCEHNASQENLMRESGHSTSVASPMATDQGAIVSIYVDDDHPLLKLKRALPWVARFEVMPSRWAAAGKNTDGRPG